MQDHLRVAFALRNRNQVYPAERGSSREYYDEATSRANTSLVRGTTDAMHSHAIRGPHRCLVIEKNDQTAVNAAGKLPPRERRTAAEAVAVPVKYHPVIRRLVLQALLDCRTACPTS